jgi:uncharacterized protein YybS (DUF2232 family)
MDRQNNTKAMVESGIFTAVAVVLILMCYFLPGFVLVGIFVWPIPITLIYIRHGAKYSIMSLVVTFILTAMTTDPLTAVGFVSVYGLLGLVLGYCISRKKAVSASIFILSGAALLSTMVVFQLFAVITGQDVISQGIAMLTKSYQTAKDMYLSMGMSQETVKKLMASLPSAAIIKMIIPAGFLTYSVSAAFICYLITQKVLKRFKYAIPPIKPLSEWYIPYKASFAIIVIMGVSFLLMYTGFQNGQTYFVNANLIFNYTFTVNAVAFVAWFLKKREVNKVFIVIIIVFCITPPIGGVLYLLGIFDYIFDFRKLDPIRKRPIE